MKTKEDVDIEEEVEEHPNDIAEVLEQIKPYWTGIIGGLVVLVGGLVAVNLFSTGQKTAREAGWSDYLAATANRDPTQMQQLADGSEGSVAAFAQQAAAQAKLIEGSQAVYNERGMAKINFEEAAQGFATALELSSGQELIQKQALLGLGQAHEGLNDLGKAKEQYQQIVDKWPNSSIAKEAQSHIDRLNDPSSKEFYDWFFAQTPPAMQLPSTGAVQGLPFETPSSTPDITIPTPGATDSSSSIDTSAGDTSSAEIDTTSVDATTESVTTESSTADAVVEQPAAPE